MSSVGKNIPHDSARGYVTGESIYIDDMPPLRGELIVDFFWSPVAHGRIRSLDLDNARAVPGIVGLFTYKDLHHNLNTVDAPLNTLGTSQLCPGSAVLDRINASLR